MERLTKPQGSAVGDQFLGNRVDCLYLRERQWVLHNSILALYGSWWSGGEGYIMLGGSSSFEIGSTSSAPGKM